MSAICAVFCVIVNSPFYFAFAPSEALFPQVIDQNGVMIHNYTRWLVGVTGFASSELGKTILFVLYGFRDLFLMLIEIILNCVSFYYIRAFLSRKNHVVGRPVRTATNYQSSATNNQSVLANNNRPQKVVVVVAPTDETSATSRVELTAAIMALTMCVLSIVEHLMIVICNVYPLLVLNGPMANVLFLYWAGDFAIALKHSMNFLIFYAFNKNFKKAIDQFFSFAKS